jgi:hypothetical protein
LEYFLRIEFIVCFSNRTYKRPTIGANFSSEREAADGAHTQTESATTSADVAVNTGTFLFLLIFHRN